MATQPLGPLWQSIPEHRSYTYRQSRDYPGKTTQPLGPPCQSIPKHRSYTSSPGIVLGWLPNPTSLAEYPRMPELHRQSRDCPGIANQPLCQNARVTPAVLGLSWDGYPTHGTSLAEYPRTPELHRQSRDCPRMATQPLCQNARVTLAVLGLSKGSDHYPTPGTSLAEYPRTPELHRQSRDCPRMTTQPLCQSIPEHRSCTSSPGIVLG